jgi:tetratricopeptide (TPR) repeat protein
VARFAKRRRGGQTAGLYFDSYFDDGRLARLANAIRRRSGAGAVGCPCSLARCCAGFAASELRRSQLPDHFEQSGQSRQPSQICGRCEDPDIENAISAYDRLLFYNPALSRVRFELGVLYARLGSYQQARAYFESALQMRDITPEMAEQAQRYIAILDRKLSPDQFTGFAQTGLRYQTNATLGPGPQPVLASGRNFTARSQPVRTGIGLDRSR